MCVISVQGLSGNRRRSGKRVSEQHAQRKAPMLDYRKLQLGEFLQAQESRSRQFS